MSLSLVRRGATPRFRASRLLAVLILAGCSAAVAPTQVSPPSPTPSTASGTAPSLHNLRGTMTLARGDVATWTYVGTGTTQCAGIRGYSDFGAGMPVVLKDQAGVVIGTGSTTMGLVTKDASCQTSFALPNVPDAPFYSIEVGHRGAMTYSKADLESKGWQLDLTLGS